MSGARKRSCGGRWATVNTSRLNNSDLQSSHGKRVTLGTVAVKGRGDDKAKTMRIAINGAGIAGPALAFWLRRSGHEPMLIEKAPRFRTGG
jgi:NADPH-dependent 2,4-dienoyl-CoA reductase/sulfur reductase-like enzyme